MEQIPLFERLGGRDGLRKICERVVDNHYANPIVATRYVNGQMDREALVVGATEFMCTGLSGTPTYQGLPLAEVHRGMNITEQEFVAVLDDILEAMASVGVAEQERGEALAILYGMKPDVVRL